MFLSFVWTSFSHSSCTPYVSYFTLVHIFFSFPSSFWLFCLLVTKRREYTGKYTDVYHYFYMTRVHNLRGRNSTSCTFIGGENHRGDTYTKGEKTSFLRKPCFALCLFSRCFMVLWVMFSIYVLLLLSHYTYVLDMHISLCYCALLIACSDDNLFCYMIIVVISIWLFWCMIKLLICFTSWLLDRILLVTLYLFFYYLIYFESLMRFVQVF